MDYFDVIKSYWGEDPPADENAVHKSIVRRWQVNYMQHFEKRAKLFRCEGLPWYRKKVYSFLFYFFFLGLSKMTSSSAAATHSFWVSSKIFISFSLREKQQAQPLQKLPKKKKIFIHRHLCCDAAIRVLWAIGCLAGNKWKSLGRRTTRGRVVENMSAAAASEPPNWTEHDAFQLLENTREQKISSLNIVLPERAVIRPNRYPLFWNTFSQQRHLAKVLRLQNVRPGCVPHHLICP